MATGAASAMLAALRSAGNPGSSGRKAAPLRITATNATMRSMPRGSATAMTDSGATGPSRATSSSARRLSSPKSIASSPYRTAIASGSAAAMRAPSGVGSIGAVAPDGRTSTRARPVAGAPDSGTSDTCSTIRMAPTGRVGSRRNSPTNAASESAIRAACARL